MVWLRYSDVIKAEECRNDNVILIGGPLTNPLTKHVFEKLDAAKELRLNIPDPCVDLLTPKMRLSPQKKDDWWLQDYGIIIKAKNPLNPTKLLFILAGVKRFGTASCGALLQYPPAIEAIVKEFGGGPFQIALSSTVVSFDPIGTIVKVVFPESLCRIELKNPTVYAGTPELVAELHSCVSRREWVGISISSSNSNDKVVYNEQDAYKESKVRLRNWMITGVRARGGTISQEEADYFLDRTIVSLRRVDFALRDKAALIAKYEYKGKRNPSEIYRELLRDWVDRIRREALIKKDDSEKQQSP